MEKVLVSIVDDHRLFRNGIAELIGHFEGYQVISQTGNGMEFIESIEAGIVPQIVILETLALCAFVVALKRRQFHLDPYPAFLQKN